MAIIQEKFRTHFKGIWSLKAALAIYFIPITVIPALFLSFYATRLFEESFRDTLDRRANSEKDAIVAEMETLDADLLAGLRRHSQTSELLSAVGSGSPTFIESALSSF